MTTKFNHAGKSFEIRHAVIDDALKIGVFAGDQRIYTLDIPLETLSDMHRQSGEAPFQEFKSFVQSDFCRLLDEGLLKA